MHISHKENENFLRKQLNSQSNIEWSQEKPYKTKIKGFYKKFKNSFEAHVEKHPKNQNEKYIWEHLLKNYPENIANEYDELSKALIDSEIRLAFPGKYNIKNNSLDIDINIQTLVDTEETDDLYTNEIIRVGIKRSHEDENKVVIATCHPRNTQKKNKFTNKGAINYFKYKTIDSNKYDRAIEYLFYPPNSNEFKEYQNRLEEITTNYLIAALEKIEDLEYYKTKYDNLELTDLYNYEEIIEHIDNLFLCNRFEEMKYDNIEFQTNENVCHKTINRYRKINDNIDKYINIKYNYTFERLEKNPYKELTDEEIENEKIAFAPWKIDAVDKWKELAKKYSIRIGKYAYNTSFKCKTIDGHFISKNKSTWFCRYELLGIAAYYGFDFEELKEILGARGELININRINEIFGIDIENDWGTIRKNIKLIIEIQDWIIEYYKEKDPDEEKNKRA